jgi:ribosomal protein S18 acetylase RimI-like enzyme
MISLKPMNNSEFQEFKTKSQSNYAANLAKVENISIEKALRHAADQFDKHVADGLLGDQQFFYQVLETSTGQPVGYLWLGLQERFGRKVMAINDIMIDSNHRGKRLGNQIMTFVEQVSKGIGVTRIRLHVCNQNEVAKRLYLSMGFETTSLDMKKELHP